MTTGIARRGTNLLIILVFLGGLLLPGLDNLMGLDPTPPLEEKRRPAWFPPLRKVWTDPSGWRQQFEAFYRDHFGFRRHLIRTHALAKTRLFNLSPSERVVLGKEGWLFYTSDRMLADHQGRVRLSPKELETWRSTLEGKKAWLARRGIGFLFVVAPNKVSVYPEYLKDRHRYIEGPTRRQQLLSYLERHSDFTILDLVPTLIEGKKQGITYYRTDTHWNQFGAYLGYREIIKALQPAYPDLAPIPLEDMVKQRARRTGDLTNMIGLNGLVDEEIEWRWPRQGYKAWETEFQLKPGEVPREWNMWEPTRCRIREDRPRRLLVFRDSFCTDMRRLLSEHFGVSVFVSLSVHRFEVLKTLVDLVRPDLVIEQRVERNLILLPEDHPEYRRARESKATTPVRRGR